VDGLDDFLPDKGDRGDPTLAVSNLQEFFTPEPVARTPPAALEPPVVAAPAREITARDNDDIRHPRNNDEIRRTDVPRLVARNNSTSVVDRPQETFAPEFAAPIRRFVEERGTPTVKRVQETFAPELDSPTRRVADEPRQIVSNVVRIEPARIAHRVHEAFPPELCAPIQRIVVEAPRLLVSDVEETSSPDSYDVEETSSPDSYDVEETSGSESDRGPGDDVAAWVANLMEDDSISDLGRVDREDPTLAVDSLEEFFAPESVARILRVVKGPRLVVSEATEAMIDLNNQDDAPADADDREAPSEFQQVAVEFRRFAEQFHAFAVDVKRK